MRKIRPYGSEGGGAARSPYPYQKFDICGVKERKSPIREPLKVTRKGDFIERLGKPKAYRWECKYHIVFIPRYRKKALYGALRQRMGGLLRELAGLRESRIEQRQSRLYHVHMLISIPPKYSVAQVVGYYEREECHLRCSDVHGQAAKLHG